MTRRTCETCKHASSVTLYELLNGEPCIELYDECDFDGVAVPCNESGVCGRWKAREERREEEEDVD